MKSKQSQLPGIQYLRAIAAILVVLTHTAGMARFPKYFNITICDGLFEAGAVGVPLFFVISGFIIGYVSLHSQTLEPKIAPLDFFKRRFIRIIPFMWVCIIGYAALRFVGRGGHFPYLEYARAIVLFPIGDVQPNQIWTLRHEFLFYGLFCIGLVRLKSQPFLFLWFLSPIVWAFVVPYIPNTTIQALGGFFFSKLNLLFGFGYIIALLLLRGKLVINSKVSLNLLWTIVALIPLLVSAHFFNGRFKTFTQVSLYGLFSSLVLIIAINIKPSAAESTFSRLLLLLGDASYAIYLTHAALVSSMLGIWSKLQPGAHWALILSVGVVISCIGGVIAHKYIEVPLIRRLQPAKK